MATVAVGGRSWRLDGVVLSEGLVDDCRGRTPVALALSKRVSLVYLDAYLGVEQEASRGGLADARSV